MSKGKSTINTPECIETFLRRMHRAGLIVTGVYFTSELVTSFGHISPEQTIALFRSLVADWDSKHQTPPVEANVPTAP